MLVLVERELNRGLALANMGTTRSSQDFRRADRSFNTATALLPRIALLSDGQRWRIEARLQELRSRLEKMAANRYARPYPESVAS